MRHTLLTSNLLAVLAAAAGAAIPPTPAVDPTYAALRAARPEKAGLAVQNLVLTRDVIRLRFESGTFFLLAPVEGRTVGAVFIGKGDWELTPATEGERRHLARVTEDKAFTKLADTFERMVLLFTDGTAEEIRKVGTEVPAPVSHDEVAKALDGYLALQKKTFRANLHLRLLADVLSETPPADGVFVASVAGKKLPGGLLAVDPRGIETLGLAPMLGAEAVTFFAPEGANPGFWYLAHRRAGPAAGVPPGVTWSPVDGVHYEIDTRVERNADIAGTTVMHLRVRASGLRVLPLSLLPKLRVESAAVSVGEGAGFHAVPFIQEDANADADLAVVLPEAPPVGARIAVRVVYKGDQVLNDHGDGNFAVEARTSWYPNVGAFSDPATFDLTYHVPSGNEVVSVGRRQDSPPGGDHAVYRFRAEQPLRVAGFNYGRFRKLARSDGGLLLQVFTNPGKPGFARDIEEWLEQAQEIYLAQGRYTQGNPDDPDRSLQLHLPQTAKFDTESLAQSALADGVNAARTCTHYFGPLPFQEVNLTQQVQWNFGQSWPSLIYLPYLAFLDSTSLVALGMMNVTEWVQLVGPHEMAHQWWGHHVGWGSYRDQWLSEGFAEFSAALVAQQTGGMRKYVDYWQKERDQLFKKLPGNTYANWEAGPISMGWRLPAGERQRGAYSAIVYTKGSFVVHMLRMMMRESGRPRTPGGKPSDPDALFIAMMRDFTSNWAGKEPTTADFQKVVERHMTRPMNLAGDGTMDWFFRQWYEGTDIPRYRHRLDVKEEGSGRYRLVGEITQSEVSGDFRMPVGLYAEFDKGRTALLARVPLTGNQTMPLDFVLPLPEKPKAIRLNALMDVLSRE